MGTAKKIKDNAPLLNPKHEAFCQLYVNGDKEFFGNGTQTYIETYDIDLNKKGAYNSARVNASQLLTKTNIVSRLNELLETGGFTNENVDKQHLFLINQHADLKTKLGAIREFNSLKKRVDQTTITVVLPEPIIKLDDYGDIQRNNSNKEDNSIKKED